jgi:hypothetical protein
VRSNTWVKRPIKMLSQTNSPFQITTCLLPSTMPDVHDEQGTRLLSPTARGLYQCSSATNSGGEVGVPCTGSSTRCRD